jgi:hypothetical protein
MTIETKNDAPSLAQLRNYATAAGILLALGVLAMTVGLIRSESAKSCGPSPRPEPAAAPAASSPPPPPVPSGCSPPYSAPPSPTSPPPRSSEANSANG